MVNPQWEGLVRRALAQQRRTTGSCTTGSAKKTSEGRGSKLSLLASVHSVCCNTHQFGLCCELVFGAHPPQQREVDGVSLGSARRLAKWHHQREGQWMSLEVNKVNMRHH
eukprot:scaffold150305_cov17-Tisochrysis_lutea.AAC.1